MVDIASLTGQSLDPTSYQSFGAAVNDFQNSGLSDALMAQQSTSNSGSSQADYSSSTRSYAQDLIKYAPKFEFLFKVDFIFNPEYVKKLNGGKSQNAFSFVILTIDRPKFSFEWEEVNYYNYRTYMARRWTAIGMGADRDQTAIGPLSSAGDPTFYKGAHFFVRTHSHATFLYQRVSHDSFCTSAGIHDHYPIHRLPHRPPIYPRQPRATMRSPGRSNATLGEGIQIPQTPQTPSEREGDR